MSKYACVALFTIFTAIANNDDDKLFLQNGRPTKGVYALFPAGPIVRDSHHRKSPSYREQGFEPAHSLSSDIAE